MIHSQISSPLHCLWSSLIAAAPNPTRRHIFRGGLNPLQHLPCRSGQVNKTGNIFPSTTVLQSMYRRRSSWPFYQCRGDHFQILGRNAAPAVVSCWSRGMSTPSNPNDTPDAKFSAGTDPHEWKRSSQWKYVNVPRYLVAANCGHRCRLPSGNFINRAVI